MYLLGYITTSLNGFNLVVTLQNANFKGGHDVVVSTHSLASVLSEPEGINASMATRRPGKRVSPPGYRCESRAQGSANQFDVSATRDGQQGPLSTPPVEIWRRTHSLLHLSSGDGGSFSSLNVLFVFLNGQNFRAAVMTNE
jgi:hypothetical protein